MSSAPTQQPTDADQTARARIRDAAIDEFGRNGVDGTSLRAVAERAGVSQPLIIHHFGSKQRLREACDEHVAAVIRSTKVDALSQGPRLDPLATLRGHPEQRPALRYLARTLGDGTPEVSALIDDLLEDALEYEAEGIRTGLIKPSRHPRERMVVMMLWQLGPIMLHEQLERLLGTDLFGEPEQLSPYVLPLVEMLSEGVFAEGLYEHMRDALADGEQES